MMSLEWREGQLGLALLSMPQIKRGDRERERIRRGEKVVG